MYYTENDIYATYISNTIRLCYIYYIDNVNYATYITCIT